MKKIIIITVITAAVLTGAWFLFFNGEGNAAGTYDYAEVKRGDLKNTITSSGTLEAISTVDVGTQVSGIISKLYVDFNAKVKKGQLLAVLDTTLLSAQVRDAQANLTKARAEYKQATAQHENNKQLYEKKFISEIDFISSETSLETAHAALLSSESSLERAKQNLSYAFIHAPIDGTIIDRQIESGQTVASNFSAPTLFTIAQDLSSMRILASVDESDIGEIKEGQKVDFTVQAYPNEKFTGEVNQIRLSPTTANNVVNYTVVIDAKNNKGLLLPGMTATVDFIIDSREDVLMVSNSALKYQPTREQFEKMREERMRNMPDSIKAKIASGERPKLRMGGAMGKRPDNMGAHRVYFC
ncbi:MAG TPA: efflux RND transporter periplasmic adaptor subunit [Ignavibacteriales bacterium]|nr:efflux RND transporter periplasmic adaptor subunit [Ignavibacteriales bacterium]